MGLTAGQGFWVGFFFTLLILIKACNLCFWRSGRRGPLMYDLAALDQASGVEALPRAGWGCAVVGRLFAVTQPTCLAHALEEILMVRFGMGRGMSCQVRRPA